MSKLRSSTVRTLLAGVLSTTLLAAGTVAGIQQQQIRSRPSKEVVADTLMMGSTSGESRAGMEGAGVGDQEPALPTFEVSGRLGRGNAVSDHEDLDLDHNVVLNNTTDGNGAVDVVSAGGQQSAASTIELKGRLGKPAGNGRRGAASVAGGDEIDDGVMSRSTINNVKKHSTAQLQQNSPNLNLATGGVSFADGRQNAGSANIPAVTHGKDSAATTSYTVIDDADSPTSPVGASAAASAAVQESWRTAQQEGAVNVQRASQEEFDRWDKEEKEKFLNNTLFPAKGLVQPNWPQWVSDATELLDMCPVGTIIYDGQDEKRMAAGTAFFTIGDKKVRDVLSASSSSPQIFTRIQLHKLFAEKHLPEDKKEEERKWDDEGRYLVWKGQKERWLEKHLPTKELKKELKRLEEQLKKLNEELETLTKTDQKNAKNEKIKKKKEAIEKLVQEKEFLKLHPEPKESTPLKQFWIGDDVYWENMAKAPLPMHFRKTGAGEWQYVHGPALHGFQPPGNQLPPITMESAGTDKLDSKTLAETIAALDHTGPYGLGYRAIQLAILQKKILSPSGLRDTSAEMLLIEQVSSIQWKLSLEVDGIASLADHAKKSREEAEAMGVKFAK